jgi:hypothetical protein
MSIWFLAIFVYLIGAIFFIGILNWLQRETKYRVKNELLAILFWPIIALTAMTIRIVRINSRNRF